VQGGRRTGPSDVTVKRKREGVEQTQAPVIEREKKKIPPEKAKGKSGRKKGATFTAILGRHECKKERKAKSEV